MESLHSCPPGSHFLQNQEVVLSIKIVYECERKMQQYLQPALSFCFLLLHIECSHQLPLQE